MSAVPLDPRAEAALLTLRENRLQLRRTLRPQGSEGFPRSRTFRWLASHLSMRSLASTAIAAAFMRPRSLIQLLSMLGGRRL
ncbi:MAG TPA: hypothetical protein VGH56_11125 [Solirubrobacteraceae bacterium]|nr:hypothetical protein [Steroidobacteraceae bacterium]